MPIRPRFKYGVICHSRCGLVELDETEFARQVTKPDIRWTCPKCGDSADWDDDSLGSNPTDDDEVDLDPDDSPFVVDPEMPDFSFEDTCGECDNPTACLRNGGFFKKENP